MHLLPMYYFKVVVKNRSINKAAQELHITQQTLSAHMNSVEKELGCVLFTRSPHFQLTYEGEKFYQYVKAITGTYESMQKEFQLLARKRSPSHRHRPYAQSRADTESSQEIYTGTSVYTPGFAGTVQ